MSTTQETLELIKKETSDALSKSITTGTGLVSYDLQAPAKNLYPTITPLRNKIPRVKGNGGLATNWRQVSAITGSGYNPMGWVPEGGRSARMSYTTANKSSTYVSIGEEDQISYEAISAAQGFEDLRATMTMRLLQKMMSKEEDAILGGNASIALGTPSAPTLSASGSSGTLPALTYSVIVVALTYEGSRSATLAGGVPTSQSITGADGLTYILNGGSSNKSTNTTQAITLGQILYCSVPPVAGAVAYAWYVGAAGSEKLEAITTINSVAFSAPLAGTHQAATAITADCSRNASLAFDGLLTYGLNAANGGYLNTLATGVAGTGTTLTSSGRGSINEIDTMLQNMWDVSRVSPTVLYVNSQELKNITTKILSNGSAPLLRYQESNEPYAVIAGGTIKGYFNPFAVNGGIMMPIMVHPNMPAGTIFGYCENLPAQYLSNDVPNTVEVHARRDYYQIDWPLRSRQQEVGVYAEEVLAVYAPFAMGVITNIANG